MESTSGSDQDEENLEHTVNKALQQCKPSQSQPITKQKQSRLLSKKNHSGKLHVLY